MSIYIYSRTEFNLSKFISRKYSGYTSQSAYAKRIIDCIIFSFPEKPSDGAIAAQINISPRWLQRECKKAFGTTYSRLVRFIHVNAAVGLMYNSRLTYSQIAVVLKYSSERNMVRDFRKVLRCSPSGVKEQLSKFSIKNVIFPNINNLIEI